MTRNFIEFYIREVVTFKKIIIWKTYFPNTTITLRSKQDQTLTRLERHLITSWNIFHFAMVHRRPLNFIRLPWPSSDSCPSLPPLALTISPAPELFNRLTLLHPGQRAPKQTSVVKTTLLHTHRHTRAHTHAM